MTGPAPDALRQALERIRRELRDGGDRGELRRRLEVLLQDVDRTVERLGQVQQDARTLRQALQETPSAFRPAGRFRQDRLGASTFIERGWQLIARGDPRRAIEALRRALELAPGELQAAALLGWAQMLQGDHDEAMSTFACVLERDPANAVARVNVGYLCLRKRVFGEAIEHLSRVIREGADRRAVLYAHFYLGLVYLERGMTEDAVAFLARAVAVGPNLIEARYDLGRALWLAGRREEARAAWAEGAQATGDSPAIARCRDALARAGPGEEPPRPASV